MSRILFLVNEDVVIYNFRFELVQEFLEMGHDVFISCPYGEKLERIKSIGAKILPITIDRRGTNLLKDYKLINEYKKILRDIKPDFVLSYTIKPNIYGSIACKKYNIPIVATITGLGNGIHGGGLLEKILLSLYKTTFKNVKKIFFQNTEDYSYFKEHNLLFNEYEIIPGSGVNLEKFNYKPYPEEISFLYAARIMKQKGIQEFLDAAIHIKKTNPDITFDVCGACDADYLDLIEKNNQLGIINYHGKVADLIDYYEKSSCIILPSYHEGMSNTLLEAAACGRPLIASNVCGCKEIIDDGKNGLLCEPKNSKSLIETIEKFIRISLEKRKEMGILSRQKVENEFDRVVVVKKYIEAFKKIKKQEE